VLAKAVIGPNDLRANSHRHVRGLKAKSTIVTFAVLGPPPWTVTEPDGTMGTIPGPAIECNIGDKVMVQLRDMNTRTDGKGPFCPPTSGGTFCTLMVLRSSQHRMALTRCRGKQHKVRATVDGDAVDESITLGMPTCGSLSVQPMPRRPGIDKISLRDTSWLE
jgi:hypothetical protein